MQKLLQGFSANSFRFSGRKYLPFLFVWSFVHNDMCHVSRVNGVALPDIASACYDVECRGGPDLSGMYGACVSWNSDESVADRYGMGGYSGDVHRI